MLLILGLHFNSKISESCSNAHFDSLVCFIWGREDVVLFGFVPFGMLCHFLLKALRDVLDNGN